MINRIELVDPEMSIRRKNSNSNLGRKISHGKLRYICSRSVSKEPSKGPQSRKIEATSNMDRAHRQIVHVPPATGKTQVKGISFSNNKQVHASNLAYSTNKENSSDMNMVKGYNTGTTVSNSNFATNGTKQSQVSSRYASGLGYSRFNQSGVAISPIEDKEAYDTN
jgi:CCR4-NOT transcriptional regulation complex NOT5 subunit